MSTSALLLTILAVVHLGYPAPLILVAANGLYFGMIFGAITLLFLVLSAHEQVEHESALSYKIQLGLLVAQAVSFMVGLFALYLVVLAASRQPI
jgi:hypothetical protein